MKKETAIIWSIIILGMSGVFGLFCLLVLVEYEVGKHVLGVWK